MKTYIVTWYDNHAGVFNEWEVEAESLEEAQNELLKEEGYVVKEKSIKT